MSWKKENKKSCIVHYFDLEKTRFFKEVLQVVYPQVIQLSTHPYILCICCLTLIGKGVHYLLLWHKYICFTLAFFNWFDNILPTLGLSWSIKFLSHYNSLCYVGDYLASDEKEGIGRWNNHVIEPLGLKMGVSLRSMPKPMYNQWKTDMPLKRNVQSSSRLHSFPHQWDFFRSKLP